MLTFTLNGQPATVDVEDDTPLLWVLRDTLGLTGTKFGCGVAACGACTVHVDGDATRTCVLPVPRGPDAPSLSDLATEQTLAPRTTCRITASSRVSTADFVTNA